MSKTATTDSEVSLYKPYMSSAKSVVNSFDLNSLDEVDLGALDSLIAITYQSEFAEINKAKIVSKFNDESNEVETYIYIKRVDRELPFTFLVGRPCSTKLINTLTN